MSAIVVLALLNASCSTSDSASTQPSDTTDGERPETSVTTSDDPGNLGGDDSAQQSSPESVRTLELVRERGRLVCGVGIRPGFSTSSSDGSWAGFEVDFCRAIAASVLGDATAVEFVDATASEDRFDLLRARKIDVLFRTSTWTLTRDADWGFGPTIFHDGQQMMGASDTFASRSEVADLDGGKVCVGVNTTSLLNIQDLVAAVGADIELVVAEGGSDQAILDFAQGGICDAVTSDASALKPEKDRLEGAPGAWVLFPATPFSKEPLGPLYRSDDPMWGDIVDWTVFALIAADELGIRSNNVENHRDAPSGPEMERLLGVSGELQERLSLAPEAFYEAILQVGNYDELFEANLVPVGHSRNGSFNASYLDAGLIYSPPFR